MFKFIQRFSTSIPTLQKLSREQLASTNHTLWAIKPFNGELTLPVYKFSDAQYTGTSIALNQDVFNQPLRRDIIYRLVRYTERLYQRITKATLTVATSSASGAKPHPQKGSGRARMGHRQKPGRNKGVKAHGVRIRELRISLPRKVRVLGIKIGLSAALYEDKIMVIDSEHIDEGKTKLMIQRFQQFGELQNKKILIVTGLKPETEFLRGISNLPLVKTCTCDRINILKILAHKKLVFTKEAIQDLQQHLQERTQAAWRQHKERPFEVKKQQVEGKVKVIEERPKYDPNQPLELKFKVLQEYLKEYESMKEQGLLNEYIGDMSKTKREGRINSVQN